MSLDRSTLWSASCWFLWKMDSTCWYFSSWWWGWFRRNHWSCVYLHKSWN